MLISSSVMRCTYEMLQVPGSWRQRLPIGQWLGASKKGCGGGGRHFWLVVKPIYSMITRENQSVKQNPPLPSV